MVRCRCGNLPRWIDERTQDGKIATFWPSTRDFLADADAYEQYWEEARPLMVNETVPMSPTRPFHEWLKTQKENSGIPNWQPPEI